MRRSLSKHANITCRREIGFYEARSKKCFWIFQKNAFTVHILENKLNVYITISNTDEHLISPYDSATC